MLRKKTLFLTLLALLLVPLIITFAPLLKHTEEKTSITHLEPRTADSKSGGGYIMDTEAPYSWIEISGSNYLTTASEADDDFSSIDISLDGWSFEFYETKYDTVYVSSNGYLTFGYDYPAETGGEIPGVGPNNNDTIALVWEDLDPSTGGSIYYQFGGSAPNRYLIIEYYHVVDFTQELQIGDCEVILYENGTILLQYKNLYDHIDPTIGLDHGDFTNYNYFDASEDLPLSSKAIKFTFDEMRNLTYSLKFEEDEEFVYRAESINHTAMDLYFGNTWEADWGFFANMSENDKMKINITSILDNNTHWDVDYDIWNWTGVSEDFDASADDVREIILRQEPLNYSSGDVLSYKFPFVLPNLTALWLAQANLFDWDIWEIEYENNISKITASTYTGDEILEQEAIYDENGILEVLEVRTYPYDFISMDMRNLNRVFRMVRIYNFSSPSYIGVAENQLYEYGVYFSAQNAPSTSSGMEGVDRINLRILSILGEDSSINRTIVLTDVEMRMSGMILGTFMWVTLANMRMLLYRNVSGFFENSDTMSFFPLLMPTNINWTEFAQIFEAEEEDVDSVDPLANGFVVTDLEGEETISYTYTSQGVLDVESNEYRGNEYFSIRLNDFSYDIDDGDDDDDDDDDENILNIPGVNLSLLLIVLSLSIIGLIWKLKKQTL